MGANARPPPIEGGAQAFSRTEYLKHRGLKMQDSLFEFTDSPNTEHLKHGEIAQVGNWQVRNFHGFHQSRESESGQWLFYVSGYGRIVDGDHVECSLLCIDGSLFTVPLDKQDRITVLGKKYGRDSWNH